MQKIKIRLPATLTNFGPSLSSLGLAVALYIDVEITPRDDTQLVVETEGEGAGDYALGLQHPVVLGMMRIFQQLERAPLGFTVQVKNQIPLNSGLGAETAFMTAGVIGANNLLGNIFQHDDLVQIAARISTHPESAISAMLGGLAAYAKRADEIIYRSLPLTVFKLIIAVPEIEQYQALTVAQHLPSQAALANMQRIPLLLEALREGNVALLSQVIENQVLDMEVAQLIGGFNHITEVARLAGTLGVTTSGGGPAMIFLANRSHDRIAEVIETAFRNLDMVGRVYVVPLDTQGVVISMMQTRA